MTCRNALTARRCRRFGHFGHGAAPYQTRDLGPAGLLAQEIAGSQARPNDVCSKSLPGR
jgi:hypothetical protein